MSALDDFYDHVCSDLVGGLGDGFVYDPDRLGSVHCETAFGSKGLTVACSTKGMPHTYLTLTCGVRHNALAELRERAGLRQTKGFDVSLNSHTASQLRGRPGRRGWRRIGSRVATGPWQGRVDTDAAVMFTSLWPYVQKVVLPYFECCSSLPEIRRSIGRRDGWCTSLQEVEVAMLIDVLEGNTKRLRRYRSELPDGFLQAYDRVLPLLEPLL